MICINVIPLGVPRAVITITLLALVNLAVQGNIPLPLEPQFVHLVMQGNIPLPLEQHQLPFVHLVRQVNQVLGQVVLSYVVFQAHTLKQDGPHALVAWKGNIPPLAQRASIVPRAIILPHSLPQVFPRVRFVLWATTRCRELLRARPATLDITLILQAPHRAAVVQQERQLRQ